MRGQLVMHQCLQHVYIYSMVAEVVIDQEARSKPTRCVDPTNCVDATRDPREDVTLDPREEHDT